MRFEPLTLPGAYLIETDFRQDLRGAFARVFCAEHFSEHGLETSFVQANLSSNLRRGTVRGLHFQRPPHAEVKLVRCTLGAVFDVIVDLRQDSPHYLGWYGAELSRDNGRMMYVPRGFAHGYQTLTAEADVHYMVSTPYAPQSEGGLRFDDPALGVSWPLPVTELSRKDLSWPLLGGARP
jgi:dTDP-4-dehydrorhamnose 3,5-epimerase